MFEQMSQDELMAFRWWYEEATKAGHDGLMLHVANVVEAARGEGLDDARIWGAIAALSRKGYIQPARSGRLARAGKTTPIGFNTYGMLFLPGYKAVFQALVDDLKRRIRDVGDDVRLSQGIGAGDVSRSIGHPEWLVTRIMEYLREVGVAEMNPGTGPRMIFVRMWEFQLKFGG